jgi:succinate-acetate transporter protein
LERGKRNLRYLNVLLKSLNTPLRARWVQVVCLTDVKLANPAPLGLMGFGMTTVLLNMHNAGLFPLDTMIMAMGIFYGGLAQVIAGIIDMRKGATFGATAFSSYGLFWLSLVFLWIAPKVGFGAAPTSTSIAAYLFMWGLFTLLMFFGTLKTNVSLMFVFASLFILFFLLSAGNAVGNTDLIRVAGIEGVICGLSAIYLSIAEILNESYGRTILPICPRKASN